MRDRGKYRGMTWERPNVVSRPKAPNKRTLLYCEKILRKKFSGYGELFSFLAHNWLQRLHLYCHNWLHAYSIGIFVNFIRILLKFWKFGHIPSKGRPGIYFSNFLNFASSYGMKLRVNWKQSPTFMLSILTESYLRSQWRMFSTVEFFFFFFFWLSRLPRCGLGVSWSWDLEKDLWGLSCHFFPSVPWMRIGIVAGRFFSFLSVVWDRMWVVGVLPFRHTIWNRYLYFLSDSLARAQFDEDPIKNAITWSTYECLISNQNFLSQRNQSSSFLLLLFV